MLDYVKYIDIVYDADDTSRSNTLKETLIQCAELMGMTTEDISENSTVIRLKLINSFCPDDYMVWYCPNPSDNSPDVYFYVASDRDTSTVTSNSSIFGNMRFSYYQNTTSYRYRFFCVESKDKKNVAWGCANIENASINLSYGLAIGKDLNNDIVKGMYFSLTSFYWYEEAAPDKKLNYTFPETNITQLKSLIMNKACVPSLGFLADSAYFPLMAYPSYAPYDVSMNEKSYLFTSTSTNIGGRIVFEV